MTWTRTGGGLPHRLRVRTQGYVAHSPVAGPATTLAGVDTGLAGKGVVVTGASGGIGAATAQAFAAEGARVLVHYNGGAERAKTVAAALGGAPTAQADLTREEDVERLFAEARAALGAVDVCAAVAGYWPRDDEPVWALGLDRWRATLDVNLTAAFLTARAFLREVERNGHGSLVLVSSTAGLFGEADHADYAAAKGALATGFLLSLKNEITRIAPRARVNCVAPGWTESPMTRGLVDPENVHRVSRTMALRKVATVHDIARHIVVLASDELSGHVTGQVVTVAGGMEGRTLHED
jgi:3-oxoacyl-[acyl-carrier protein] reductase